MTEEDARLILRDSFDVSRETLERIELFIALLKEEMEHQNLISKSSLDHIWVRHILDSAQLLNFISEEKAAELRAGVTGNRWLDMGSGAGFPGIIIALMSDWHVVLLESRARRIAYLEKMIDALDLNASVAGVRAEVFDAEPFSIISARASAPLPKLLRLSKPFSTRNTLYLLPKGRNAANELLEVKQKSSYNIEIKPSITDEDAGILVGTVRGAL